MYSIGVYLCEFIKYFYTFPVCDSHNVALDQVAGQV